MSNTDLIPTDIIIEDAEAHGLTEPVEDGEALDVKQEPAQADPLAGFIADTDYRTANGDFIHGAPAAWTALWWSSAKERIAAAEAAERKSLLLDTIYAVGRAISSFPGERHKDLRSDAVRLVRSLDSHFKLSPGGYMGYEHKILEGEKAGPYKDGEEIPDFLGEALDEIPDPAPASTAPAAQGEEREHGSLSGITTGSDGTLPDRLPPPPLEVFPPEIRFGIEQIATTKGVPVEMVMSIVISLVSACVGRGRGIAHRKEWREHANLFMILIAETGAGKSHTFKYIFQELLKLEAERKAQYKIEYRQYLEDMAAHRKSKDPEKKLPARPVNIQYLLDDSTMEAASERMEDNPKGLFWSIDEMSGFFSSLDKYNRAGNDGKRRLLSAWNAETWNTSRKSKDGMLEERYIAKGAMGIYGGIQPHLLRQLFSYDDVKQGLPQRFMYVRAVVDKPMRMDTPEIPKEVDDILAKITRRKIGLEMVVDQYGQNQAEYLTFEADARAEIVHHGDLVTARTFGTAAYDYAVKMNQMLLRIALILHILEWAAGDEPKCPNVIGYDTAIRAIRLAGWFAEHTEAARAFFPGAAKAKRGDAPAVHGAKEKLREIIMAMSDEDRKIFRSREEIQALIGDEISKEQVGKALAALGISRKQVREVKKVRGGYYLSDCHECHE